MAATFAAGMARHRAGAEATVDRLIQLGELRADLSREDAVAVVATLTAPERIRRLATQLGMTTVAPDKIRIVGVPNRKKVAAQ